MVLFEGDISAFGQRGIGDAHCASYGLRVAALFRPGDFVCAQKI